MQRFEAGTVIDGFELVEKLPAGGMASLWRATNPRYDFPLVLKIPFLDPGGDVSVILGFEAEELILKRLSGPHVPRFAAAGSLSRVPYIAMEFVSGTGLADLAGNAPLPVDEVARIGIEIATALAALHRQKVVHLDLKPENVILAERGAVLLDFGLARHAELPDLLGAESSVPMGTAAYISPEQVLGERSDPASDLFALGCILYQLATGEEPFGRPATFAGMKRRLYHAPRRSRSQSRALLRLMVSARSSPKECTSTPRSRKASTKTSCSWRARLTHSTSSKSSALQLSGVSLRRLRSGRWTITSRSRPTSEWTPRLVIASILALQASHSGLTAPVHIS